MNTSMPRRSRKCPDPDGQPEISEDRSPSRQQRRGQSSHQNQQKGRQKQRKQQHRQDDVPNPQNQVEVKREHQQHQHQQQSSHQNQQKGRQKKRKQQHRQDDVPNPPNQVELQREHQHQQHRKQSSHQNQQKGRQKQRKQQPRKDVPNPSNQVAVENEKNVLCWNSSSEYVPLCEEEAMVRMMMERNGPRERGMIFEKPPFLLKKFKSALQQHAQTMCLPQALSLRRHHIKLLNPYKRMSQLRLGEEDCVRESAQIFEVAVEKFLKERSIEYLTEEDQKEQAKANQERLTATPDFVLPSPTLLRKIQNGVLEERKIHWIEAKMYFGASSIPHGSKGAVGSIMKTAQRYVNQFGNGAFVFMMGCGDKLAGELNEIGISVLDCSGNTVSLEEVHEHQRTWCANQKGEILP